MNSRERIQTLLNHQIPDRMGLFEHYWGETFPAWNQQGYPQGAIPEKHFDYDIWPAWGWFNSEPFAEQTVIVEEDEERKVVRDGRGATLRYWKNKSGTPEHLSFECVTPEVWKKYREPLLHAGADRIKDTDIENFRKMLADNRAAGKFVTYHNLFVFELMRATLGDVVFLPALLEEPEWIEDFCQVYLDFYIRAYTAVFEKVGKPDGMFIYEDLAFSNGLFCSPKTLKARVMPFHKKLFGFFHDHGLPVIMHSCGDVRKAVDLIREAGVDCLQPLEAKAGVDVRELAKIHGSNLCYMGNINVMKLETNDREVVRDEIVPKLEFLRENRIPYVFHSDHSIPPTVNYDTYQYALELFRKHATY